MKPSESVRVVTMLLAYRPNLRPPEETVPLWAQSVQRFDFDDAVEAAQILGQSGRWTPVLADFIDAIRDCEATRHRRERVALPGPKTPTYYPLALFLHENPEMGERVAVLETTQYQPEVRGAENAIVPTLAEILAGEMPGTDEGGTE